MTKFNKPIAFFDLETSGTNPVTDKIIQICVWIIGPDFKPMKEPNTKLINPEISIPAGATEVHGITDEMVKDQPVFKQFAKGLYEYMKGCDLAGFNIANFDVPMLSEEFARCGLEWPELGAKIFDACKIFHNKEKRDLSAAVQFYTMEEHSDAHDAEGDVRATFEVFKAQLEAYEDLREMDAGQLQDFCLGEKRIDIAGYLVFNEHAEPIYNFGKNKGKRVIDETNYAQWMLKSDFPSNTKKVLRGILKIEAR